MPFDSSLLYPDESVLDEDSALPGDGTDPGQGRGRVPRNWLRIPHGALPGARPFAVPTIARTEWDDRIKDIEQNGRRLSDLRLQANIPSLHQGTTNYCWCNAVISAMLINQAKQGGTVQKLSPASVAAPVKGYRNLGGFNGEALEYIVTFGVCPQQLWPPNAIDPQFDTNATREARKRFKITEWWELGNRRFDQLMTLLLLGIPVPIGLDWWGHEVCALDPVKLGTDRYGVRIWNSWGEIWQDRGISTTNGMAVLSQELAAPDDAVAPRF